MPAEKAYDACNRECACVIWAAKKWKHYLYAVPHTCIVTDSYGLQFLQEKAEGSLLEQRWLCPVESFSYTVQYRRGEMNIADFLSRQNDVCLAVTTRSAQQSSRLDYRALNQGEKRSKPSDKKDEEQRENRDRKKDRVSDVTKEGHEEDGKSMIVNYKQEKLEEIKAMQEKDSGIQRLWDISCGKEVYQPSEREIQDAVGLIKVGGVVMKEKMSPTGEHRARIVVPLALQRQVVEEAHQQSHAGVFGTREAVRKNHWFRGMRVVVREAVRHCLDRIARKGRRL